MEDEYSRKAEDRCKNLVAHLKYKNIMTKVKNCWKYGQRAKHGVNQADFSFLNSKYNDKSLK